MIKSGKDVVFASKLIREGKLVVFPTETVYGLGTNGLNAKAVAKIFEVKNRPLNDPLILHISSIDDLYGIFKEPISPIVKRLAEKYMPGPLTIVAPRQKTIPGIVTAGLPTVAVRMPSHPIAMKLIRLAGVPVAAPSANIFGRLSPTLPKHVRSQLKKVDYMIEGAKTTLGIESTIVSVLDDTIQILRPGSINETQIQNDFPDLKVVSTYSDTKINSPGQMKSHYTPEKPLYLLDELPEDIPENVGVISIGNMEFPETIKFKTNILSRRNDMDFAATNLFIALHRFEQDPEIEKIYVLKIKEEGIGIAIMDRLKKAAYRYTFQGALAGERNEPLAHPTPQKEEKTKKDKVIKRKILRIRDKKQGNKGKIQRSMSKEQRARQKELGKMGFDIDG